MLKHSKRIFTTAPQLLGSAENSVLQKHVSILKDLDPPTRAARTPWRWMSWTLPMLGLSALAGGIVASYISDDYPHETPPAAHTGTTSSLEGVSPSVRPTAPQAHSAAPAIESVSSAPSAANSAASILDAREFSSAPHDATSNNRDASGHQVASLSPAVPVAPIVLSLPEKKPAAKPKAPRKRAAADKTRQPTIPRDTELAQAAAAERDVDIITAIVKGVSR